MNLRTLRSKQSYVAKGKATTCKICGHEFRHLSKEDKAKWISNKQPCPKCGEEYCNKPKTERMLMKLQDKYLVKKHKKYMEAITKILLRYIESILKKKFSYYINSYNDLAYYRDKTASFIIEEFYCKDDYRIWGSWAGLIDRKIRQSLFEKNEKSIESLIRERNKDNLDIKSLSHSLEDGHFLDIADPFQDRMFNGFEKQTNKELLNKFFIDSIKYFFNIYSLNDMYRTVFALKFRYLTDNKKVSKFFKSNNKTGEIPYLKLLELFKKELVNIL